MSVVMSVSSHAEWLPAKVKVNCETYRWQIEQFASQMFQYVKSRNGYDLYGIGSPVFVISMVKNGELKKLSLQLSLAVWQRGLTLHVSNSVGLILAESDWSQSDGSDESAEISDFRNTCVAWIAGKKEYRSTLSRRMCNGLCYFVIEEFVPFNDLFDERKGLLRDGQLAIVCEVRATTSDVAFINGLLFDPFKPVLPENKGNTLAGDIQKRREEGKNTDFTVVARDGREFPVHTFILSSRSVYFDTMFKHDMKETREKRVVIDDISPEAVAGLLDFMYTDAVPNIDSIAPDLYFAVHRYNIPSLMSLCEETMVSNMNVDNAAELYQLADFYDAIHLLPAVKQFIIQNLKKVKDTNGWKECVYGNAQLVDELLEDMAEIMAELTSP